jgi:hypothetical protein
MTRSLFNQLTPMRKDKRAVAAAVLSRVNLVYQLSEDDLRVRLESVFQSTLLKITHCFAASCR